MKSALDPPFCKLCQTSHFGLKHDLKKKRGPASSKQKKARGRGNQGDHAGRRQFSQSKYSPRSR